MPIQFKWPSALAPINKEQEPFEFQRILLLERVLLFWKQVSAF